MGLGVVGCDVEDRGGGGAAVASMAVDCSFVFDQAQIDVTFAANESVDEVGVGGDLVVSGTLWDDEYEGRSFEVTVYAPDGSASGHALYQFADDALPHNEFVGDHGFTGLNWVRDPASRENVQYACFAREASDPVHRWED